MKHEVVVYRSPVEAWYWDNPQYIVYFVVSAVALVLIFLLLQWLFNRPRRR
jgi:hypothetical protein